MLGFFLEPYPDEIFYSQCARFGTLAGYPSAAALVTDLFGTRSLRLSPDLPSHLGAFVARLPVGTFISLPKLIDDHTLYPLYAPFLPEIRAAQVRQAMIDGEGNTIHGRVGLRAWKGTIQHILRLCPTCTRLDEEQYGEPYWHRAHQVPWVMVCPQHAVDLMTYDTSIFQAGTGYKYLSAKEAKAVLPLPTSFMPTDQERTILVALAQETDWLLSHPQASLGLRALYQRYLIALNAKGWIREIQHICLDDLQQAFLAHYSSSLLQALNCSLSPKYNWLQRLVLSSRNAHSPVRHLLLTSFLGFQMAELLALPVRPSVTISEPFGPGPFPCLNPVCEHYQQLVIQSVAITSDCYTERRPIGTFACQCGYTYTRTYLNPASESASFSQTGIRILAFGEVWEKALYHKWEDATLSLRAIARYLGVTARTVQFQAARLNLPFPRPGHRDGQWAFRPKRDKATRQAEHMRQQAEHRRAWQQAQQEKPDASCTELRRALARSYTWLYRHDRIWLMVHSPLRPKQVSRPPRIDWAARDEALAQEVRVAAQAELQRLECPRQITVSLLGRGTRSLGILQQHLAKLPKTQVTLVGVIETGEAFALRRIQWWRNRYCTEGRCPKRWEFIRDAGLARWQGVPAVEQALDAALRSLSNY